VVYGEAQVDERHKTWDMLKYIRGSNDLPWLCIGDFNEVLHREEHMGVNERSWTQIAGFRDVVDVCGLCDLGYRGVPWTFEKRVAGGSFCRVRLDRGLATPAWCERFPEAEVHHLPAYATSDHLPILLKLDPGSEQQARRCAALFRYEVM
jgi:endonuclease/exonuclease/phosphatase family metal-dependent hydrolase